MNGLRAFIEARLAEDEEVARAAILSMNDTGEWSAYHDAGLATVKERGYYIVAGEVADETAEHIAQHDPARVLREVAAKRAMLAAVDRWEDPHPGVPCTNEDDPWQECELHAAATGRLDPYVLRLLASVWSDHPDYLSEWAPENVVPTV